MTALLVIMGLAILLLAVLVVGLLRSHAEILRALHQLGVSEEGTHTHDERGPRPRLNAEGPSDITGETIDGSTVHVGVVGADTRTLVGFLSSGCMSCVGLWNTLANNDPVAGLADTRFVIVVKGPEAESKSRLLELAPDGFTIIQSSQAWDDYGVPVTPFFVMIDGETGSIVGEGSASSWQQVRSLIVQADADVSVESGEFRADAELRRAGIGPGDPSLYPEAPPMKDSHEH